VGKPGVRRTSPGPKEKTVIQKAGASASSDAIQKRPLQV